MSIVDSFYMYSLTLIDEKFIRSIIFYFIKIINPKIKFNFNIKYAF